MTEVEPGAQPAAEPAAGSSEHPGVVPDPPPGGVSPAPVEDRLRQAIVRLTELADVQRSESMARRSADEALAASMTQVNFELTALEQRLRDNVVALTHMVETQRSDLEAVLDSHPGRAGPDELGVLGARIDGLLQHAQASEERLAALEREVRLSPAAGSEPPPSRRPAPPEAGAMVDALERQLREAEARLTRHASSTPDLPASR